MKSTKHIQAKFNTVAQYWLRELNRYTEEQFSRKLSSDDWSIGQVYEHLSGGTLRFHLRHIDTCLSGKGGHGNKTLPGKVVFFLGSFPKRKIKVPASPEYTPQQPASIASLCDKLEKLIEQMNTIAPQIELSSPGSKSRHPFLGALNAHEWYELIEMHFRHHLQQKERLDKFLGVNQ